MTVFELSLQVYVQGRVPILGEIKVPALPGIFPGGTNACLEFLERLLHE